MELDTGAVLILLVKSRSQGRERQIDPGGECLAGVTRRSLAFLTMGYFSVTYPSRKALNIDLSPSEASLK